ncbi:MAG: putative sulfate exporter family transporter [Paludibacter sp.]|nr:putative sulfate exporter family transporter [Paludibacter sp.]
MSVSDTGSNSKAQVVSKVLYVLLAVICILPIINAPIALFLGLVLALTVGCPYPKINRFASKYLLQVSVVGLGFGMNINEAMKAGSDGLLFTVVSVVSVLTLGIILGKWLGLNKINSFLISSGTAICGGSAIAAVGPISKASESEMSVSLATIFILNAIALFIFPVLGHFFDLSQYQFGLWSAIAIHDTSSVVGAGASYGEEALKIATTVKLTRALWIIPLSIFAIYFFKAKGEKISIPWFILLFILAMIANTYISIPEQISSGILFVSHRMLVVTLFFIGAALTRSTLNAVGLRPLILGVTLWIFIAVVSLVFIKWMY